MWLLSHPRRYLFFFSLARIAKYLFSKEESSPIADRNPRSFIAVNNSMSSCDLTRARRSNEEAVLDNWSVKLTRSTNCWCPLLSMSDTATPLNPGFFFLLITLLLLLVPQTYSPSSLKTVSSPLKRKSTLDQSFFLILILRLAGRGWGGSLIGASMSIIFIIVALFPLISLMFDLLQGNILIENYSIPKLSILLFFFIALIEAFGFFLRWATASLRLSVNLMVGALLFSFLPSPVALSSSPFLFFLSLLLFLGLRAYEALVIYFQLALFFYLVTSFTEDSCIRQSVSLLPSSQTRPVITI